MLQTLQLVELLQLRQPVVQATHCPLVLMNLPAGQMQAPLTRLKLGLQAVAWVAEVQETEY